MWNLFKTKQPAQNVEETEFTFIWYKKMINGNTTHYTQPFRTKVKAKTREEAFEKLTKFCLSKMTLCVFEEKDFDSSEIISLQKTFNELNKQMEATFDKIKT